MDEAAEHGDGASGAAPPPMAAGLPPNTATVDFLAAAAGLAAVGAWFVGWLQARSAWDDVDGTFGASAPQISQISDEAQLELMQYWALAGGLTTLALLLTLWAIAGRVTR
ncbi:MAG: hypothetical protein AAGA90_07775 [Actinomycetota bacterium]